MSHFESRMKEDWEAAKRDLMDLLGTGPLHNIHLAAGGAGGDVAGPFQGTPARYAPSSLRGLLYRLACALTPFHTR